MEVDGPYRPLHGTDLEFNRRVRFAHLTWEFPALIKYRLPLTGKVRLILEGGPSFRAEGNLNLGSVSHFGTTVGAGFAGKFAGVKLAPVFRYTRWTEGERRGTGSKTHANQTQLLLSVSF